MKSSSWLMIFATIGALFGWIVIPDDVGKVMVFSMAFIAWVASYICRAIERNGREG